MRVLVLTDIHGNLPALRAVLQAPEAAGCDCILSCGDHTGFGPKPRQVQAELTKLGALLLAGNHDERLPLAGTPAFSGYNWTLLRWTAEEMAGLPIAYPRTHRIGPVLFAHGTPEDPNYLMEAADLPALLQALPQGVTCFVSGHNHIPWQVTAAGRTAFNPGSLGLLEGDGDKGGIAPFGVVEISGGDCALSRFTAAYDTRETARDYLTSGAAQAAPEMCRMALHTMNTQAPQAVLRFIRLALGCAERLHTTLADPVALREADRLWPWGDGRTAEEFWQHMQEEL